MVGESFSESFIGIANDEKGSDDNKEYGEDVLEEENEVEIEIPEKEIAENEEGLLNKMKTDEERLSDHKNFLGQWEMMKQFGLGLHGSYIFCK